MRRTPRYALIFLLALLLAPQAWAGTVYVLYPGPVEIGGIPYETQIWASNADGESFRRLEHFFIRSISDGTERETEPTPVGLPAGVTKRLAVDRQTSGLLEVSAPPEVVVNARLVPAGDQGGPTAGVQLPVISSASSAEAGEALHLQGWERIESLISTNLGLVNLGDDESQCEVSVFRSDGSQIGPTVLLGLNPRSHVQFDQALGILETGDIQDVRSTVRCNTAFYTYASVYHQDPVGATFILPSATGASALNRPGTDDFIYLDVLDWVETANVRNGPNRNISGFNPHSAQGEIGGYKPIEINGKRYEHGVSWFPGWGNSAVTWQLDGEYTRFTATVRIDDEKRGDYEWGRVNRKTGELVELERPAGGFRASETDTLFRVGAGARIQIFGDGQVLFESDEFYAYGPAVQVDIDVRGVKRLRVVLLGTHHELRNAPHRAGLRSTPALVRTCSWFDLIDLADAKLYTSN